MNSQIEDIGPCKKKLVITITSADLKEELEAGFKEASRYAQVPGFRSGKIPRSVLEKRFGEQIRGSVKEQAVEKAYREALEEHDLEPLGDPQVEGLDAEELDLEQDLTFQVSFEIFPQFELGETKGLEVRKETISVTAEEVEQAMQHLAQGQARLEPVEDAEVGREDHVKCELELFAGEESVKKHEEAHLSPMQPLPGSDPEEFTAKLLGKRAGEEAEIPMNYPADFPEEACRGHEGRAVVRIKEVLRLTTPELNDEFAKNVGIEGGLEEMRTKVEEGVKARKEMDEKRRQEEELVTALIAENEFELPTTMVDKQVEARLSQKRQELERQGMPKEEVATKVAAMRDEVREGDIRGMKKVFILREVAKKEKIYVTESEIGKAIQAMASEQKVSEGEMRQRLEKADMLGELRFDLMERKVLDHLMESATVVEK